VTASSARFARGVAWSLAATIAGQGANVVVGFGLARLLGPRLFGEWGMLQSTVVAWGALAGLGLGLTATRYVALHRDEAPARATAVAQLTGRLGSIAGLAVSVLLALLSSPLAQRLSAPHLSGLVAASSVLLWSNAVAGVQNGVLAGLERFPLLGRLNALRGGLIILLTLVGGFLGGLAGAVAGSVAAALAGVFAGAKVRQRAMDEAGLPRAGARAPEDLGVLVRFTLPALLSSLLTGPALWVAHALLVRTPGGYEQLALVNATGHVRSALMLLPSVFQSVALPMLARRPGAVGDGAGADLLALTQSLSLLVIFPAGVAAMGLSGPLMALYGPAFAAGDEVAVLVSASVLVQAVTSVTGPLVQSAGRMWVGFLLNLTFALGLDLAVGLLAPSLGARAFALGLSAGYGLMAAWGLPFLRASLPRGLVTRATVSVLWAAGATMLLRSVDPWERVWWTPLAVVATTAFVLAAAMEPDVRRALVAVWRGRRAVRLMPFDR
jgi:O-antigen/teichoic acid export membrane protein